MKAHIRFRELSITNFLSFGKTQVLKLSGQGLTLIEGRNGQGKSTILDALLWVLYGRQLRKLESVDKVVSRWTKRDCCVKVKFEIGEVKFEVHRYRAHSKYKNKFFIFANGKDITRKDTADKQLVEILGGLDFNTFSRTVVFSKRDLVSFAALSDTEQKAVFEKLLGVEELNVAFRRAQDKLREQKSEQEQVALGLKSVEDRIEQTKALVQALTKAESEFEMNREDRIHTLKTQLREVKEEVTDYGDLKESLALAKAVHEKALKARSKWRRESEEANEACDAATDARAKALSAKQFVEEQQRDWEERLDPLIGVDTCPTCETRVSATQKKKWKEKLAKLTADMQEADRRFRKAHQTLDAAARKRDEMRRHEREASVSCAGTAAKIEALTEELSEARSAKKELAERQATLERRLQKAKADTWSQADELQRAQAQLAEAQESLSAGEAALKAMTRRVKYTEFWVRGFGRAGLPTDLIDSVVPVLTQRAQNYLSRISGGAFTLSFDTQTTLQSGETRDKFVVKVDNTEGADSYGGNSVGELAKVDLAISLALQDLLAMRSKSSVNIQFFDEAFDGTDSIAADTIAELLTDIAQTKESLFVVTHLDTLKAAFPHVWHVEKHKKFSQVTYGS